MGEERLLRVGFQQQVLAAPGRAARSSRASPSSIERIVA
jgi:hypothetical protein